MAKSSIFLDFASNQVIFHQISFQLRAVSYFMDQMFLNIIHEEFVPQKSTATDKTHSRNIW